MKKVPLTPIRNCGGYGTRLENLTGVDKNVHGHDISRAKELTHPITFDGVRATTVASSRRPFQVLVNCNGGATSMILKRIDRQHGLEA